MATEDDIKQFINGLRIIAKTEHGYDYINREIEKAISIIEVLAASPSDEELEKSAIAHFDAMHEETWRMMMAQYPDSVYKKAEWHKCDGNWQDHHRAKATEVIKTSQTARIRSIEL